MLKCYTCAKPIVFKPGPNKKVLACDSNAVYIVPDKSAKESFLDSSGQFRTGRIVNDGIRVYRVHKCN